MALQQMQVTVIRRVKRRTSPSLSASQLAGLFEAGTYTMDVSEPETHEDFVWRQFDDGDRIWWSATGRSIDPDEWVTVRAIPISEEELAELRRQLAAAQQENAELRARVADLEKQLADRWDERYRDALVIIYDQAADALGYEEGGG